MRSIFKSTLWMVVVLLTLSIQACSNQSKLVPFVDENSVFDGSIILGRPTSTSMSASIVANTDSQIKLIWGLKSQTYPNTSGVVSVKSLDATLITMNDLESNGLYYYRLAFKAASESEYKYTEEYTFSTPKAEGSEFSFVIQSDSHLLNKADKDLYALNMIQMNELNPDFMFDLGDTFLNDQSKDLASVKLSQVESTYLQQLPYLSVVAREAPLFLTIGNHEGEYGSTLDGTVDNIAAYSTLSRLKYYPNPIPNDFYSGNTEEEALFGQVENYYAFTWGDALFVSIDPYRYSDISPYTKKSDNGSDGWDWTLGKTQYDWFRETLENSSAKYKFVFSHHAIGNFRGGKEIATLYEWGGYDPKGKYLFDEKRPDWGKPIQTIMKDTGVSVFFQGHDHLFSREDVDGIAYVTLPKPAETTADAQNNLQSYPDGDTLLNSGFLNVTVSSDNVQIDYIRTYYMGLGSQTDNTGVVYSFTVNENHEVNIIENTTDDLSTYGQNQGEVSTETGSNLSQDLTEVSSDAFAFAIQADSHLDTNTDPEIYTKTLQFMAQTNPSFVMDLGDTFMSEKEKLTSTTINQRYQEVKSYLDILSDIPLYLVNGNHDGEYGTNLVLKPLAEQARLNYFPPSKTITNGNTSTANYYSFTKNKALFIVLDPYTYTTEKMGSDGWNGTLGKTQYDWLVNTLKESTATTKFVFIHSLIAGNGVSERGGIEAASYFEWGGNNIDDTYGFDENRPGWGKPIHDVLLEYGVSAVFHGHDHFYAQQTLDGIIYQLVPQPGTVGNTVDQASAYGYKTGLFLPSAGFIRVVVSDQTTIVEYLKTESDSFNVLARYTIETN